MKTQGGQEKKKSNKSRIARFILTEGSTSKPEIASALKLSMPTVLQNMKELTDAGLVQEVGEYESTGGRKAKALSMVPDFRYSVGIDITANHVSYVLIDLTGTIVCQMRHRLAYCHEPAYYKALRDHMDALIRQAAVEPDKVLGTGISLPGIIDRTTGVLVKSHALNVEQISLQLLGQYFDEPPVYENDATAAAMAELRLDSSDAVYLSLSNTVGGAIYLNQAMYEGRHCRSGEFGHMILVPGGKDCYCGKKGCIDAYCSAHVLSCHSDDQLELFFKRLEEKDPELEPIWDQYLDDLAIAVSNLRMSFDCDIVLGGYVGGFLAPYITELRHRVLEYNGFDKDSSYLRLCQYTREASAVGVALRIVDRFLEGI